VKNIEDQIAVMSGIFEYILRFHSLDTTNNRICELACQMLGADATSIMMFEKDEPDTMRIKASYGLSKSYVKIVFAKVGVDLAGIAIQERKYKIIENIPDFFNKNGSHKSLKWVKEEGLVSVICFPIYVENKDYGALNFYFKKSYKINKDQLLLMDFFVKLSAIAIRNNENFLILNQNMLRLVSLNEISKSITSTISLDKLWMVIYKETSKYLNTKNFTIAIYDKRKKEIEFVFTVENNKKTKPEIRKFSNGFTEHIIKTRKPILITSYDLALEKKLKIQGIGKNPRSWLGVPIIFENNVIGVIIVQDYENTNSYNEVDQKMLMNIASQAAIAIKNAKLYKKTQDLAVHDGLTNLFNSRYFYKILNYEMKRVNRYGENIMLLIFDLDNFKMINDTHGHIIGDKYLKELCHHLSLRLRGVDLLARYGGDEFVIISHKIEIADEKKFMERILSTVSKFKCKIDNGKQIQTTCCIGAVYYPYDDIKTEKELVKRADIALYKAKKSGNNKFFIQKNG
jgi:diguanylate cyclase (GGDEF)-like protein